MLRLLALLPLALAFQDYTPETYPDSLMRPVSCGIAEPGFLCDPNGVLLNSNGSQLTLLHKLVTSQGMTNCSCDGLQQNLGQCDKAGKGFIISIALTQKMVLNDDERDRDSINKAAEMFAATLRTRQGRGHCQDDILIFLSEFDKVVWTSIGTTTQQFLSDEMISSISTHADTFFKKEQYYEGLNYMIDSYVTVLRGEHLSVTDNNGWYWPLPLWSVIVIGCVVGLLVLAAIGLSIWCCVKRCCANDGRGEYHMADGSRL